MVEEGTSRGLDGPDFDRIAVYRFRADGSRDTSLGGDGGVSAPGYVPEVAYIRFNGAVTFTYERFDENVWGVGQLNSAGAWDSSFAGDGRLDFLGSGGQGAFTRNGVTKGLAIDASGRPLVRVDVVYSEESSISMLVRLTANGAYDSSFGDGGHAGLASPVANEPSQILPTPSGHIYTTFGDDTIIKVFTASGQVDKGFHNGGEVGVGVGPASAMSVDSKNRLLIGGTAGSPSCGRVRLVLG